MAAEVIDGKAHAAKMKEQIAVDAKALADKGHKPHLLALQLAGTLHETLNGQARPRRLRV